MSCLLGGFTRIATQILSIAPTSLPQAAITQYRYSSALPFPFLFSFTLSLPKHRWTSSLASHQLMFAAAVGHEVNLLECFQIWKWHAHPTGRLKIQEQEELLQLPDYQLKSQARRRAWGPGLTRKEVNATTSMLDLEMVVSNRASEGRWERFVRYGKCRSGKGRHRMWIMEWTTGRRTEEREGELGGETKVETKVQKNSCSGNSRRREKRAGESGGPCKTSFTWPLHIHTY